MTLQKVNFGHIQMPVAPKPIGLETHLKSKKVCLAQMEPYMLTNPNNCDSLKSEFCHFEMQIASKL